MRILAVLSLTLLWVGPALAVDSDLALRLDTARKLITIQETDDALAAKADAYWPNIADSLKTAGVNPDDASIAKFKQEWFVEYKKLNVGFADQLAQAFASTFTLDELRAVLQFYDSPLGKKMQAKEPELIRTLEPAERQVFHDQVVTFTRQLLHDYLAAQPPVGPAA